MVVVDISYRTEYKVCKVSKSIFHSSAGTRGHYLVVWTSLEVKFQSQEEKKKRKDASSANTEAEG